MLFFSLNVYDFLVCQGAAPLASYLEKLEFGDFKMFKLFGSFFGLNL